MPTLSTDNLLPKIVQWQCAVKRLFTSILFASSMDLQKMHLKGIFFEVLAILLPFILSINLIFVPGLSSLEDRGKGGGQDGSGPDKPDSDFRQFHYKPASSESKSKFRSPAFLPLPIRFIGQPLSNSHCCKP